MGNNTNGNGGPIILFPEDQQGANVEHSQIAFYVNAAPFHGHQYVMGAKNEGA